MLRRTGIVIALLALAACASLPPVPPAVSSPMDLDRSGVGAPVFRIPALTVTKKGTLIASYDARPSGDDLPSHIALVIRRSTDNGATWRDRQVVRTADAPLGFGDPSLIVDQQTGRIFLFHAASVNQGFFGATVGNRDDDPNVLHADYSFSDDDGVTWQHRRLTSTIKAATWGGLFASSGEGIQIRRGRLAGRLVQQYAVRINGGNFAASAFSDDHGNTWHMGTPIGPGLDENKVVELADGTLMLNIRAKPMRKVATSSDGGATWTNLHDEPALPDPANNGAIIRYAPDTAPTRAESHWLLFSNTASTTTRANLTVRLSCDDGHTWPHAKVIEPGAAAYSTLTRLPNGRVGLLYEGGKYATITFVAFDVRSVGDCTK